MDRLRSTRRAAAFVISALVLAGCGGRDDESAKEPGAAAGTAKPVDCCVGDCRLVVTGLEAVGPKKLKGCGYDLKLIHQPTAKTVFQRSTGEAGLDEVIDYSDLNLGVLRVTQLTLDPRKPDEDVAFVETVARVFKDGHCETKGHILIEPEHADAAGIAKWRDAAIAAIAAGAKSRAAATIADNAKGLEAAEAAERDYLDALGHLRNIAIETPEPVIKAYDAIEPLSGGGAWTESLAHYREEVNQIANLRARK